LLAAFAWFVSCIRVIACKSRTLVRGIVTIHFASLTPAFDAFVSYTVVVHLKVFDDVCRSEYVSTIYLDPVVQATIVRLQSRRWDADVAALSGEANRVGAVGWRADDLVALRNGRL
jgi:hypothetical protein